MVTLIKEIFLKALTDVYQAVSENSPLPILLNFYMKQTETGLNISGTDLEIFVSETVPVLSADRLFEIAAPASKLVELIRLIQDDIITLNLDGDVLVIKTRNSNHRLKTFPANEFGIDWDAAKGKATLQSFEVKRLIELTAIAAATDAATGGVLLGVYLEADKDGLAAASADRYRYTIFRLETKSSPWHALVPAKQLVKLPRILGDEPVEIGLRSNLITFSSKNVVIGVTLLEGNFPNYKAFPFRHEKGGLRATVSTPMLLNASKQARLFVNEANSMALEFKGSLLHLSTDGNELGRSTIQVDISSSGSIKDLVVHCNPGYLCDILSTTSSPAQVTISMEHAEAPILIYWGEEFAHGIMPIKG